MIKGTAYTSPYRLCLFAGHRINFLFLGHTESKSEKQE